LEVHVSTRVKKATTSPWEDVFSRGETYTPEEIAAKIKASPRQIRRWMSEGKLQFTDLPRGRRILGEWIIDFLSGRTVEPGEG
jgi:hypothetical protein